MNYYVTKNINMSFDESVKKVKQELYKKGFHILYETDLNEILNKELGLENRPYKIIGVISPIAFYRAIQRDEQIGNILPNNIIIQQSSNGMMISAEDIEVKMKVVNNSDLNGISGRIQEKINNVLDRI
jgi:uncharacterized protein (DUF302 family)